MFWSSGTDGTAGVGFAISDRFDHINPVPINDRPITARIPLKNNTHLTLISVYAPTVQRTMVEKESFYEKLSECIVKARGDNVIVLGDFNTCVGKDWQVWPSVIGKHGTGKINSNGLMLLEFCTRFSLSIMGMMFQLRNCLKDTWQHLRSRQWHQIDHVLANRTAKQFINVTKIDPAADCFMDHKLLITKCCFLVKKKRKIKPPSKPDTTLNIERKKKLELFLEEKLPHCKGSWDSLKEVLQHTAKHVFGKKKRGLVRQPR